MNAFTNKPNVTSFVNTLRRNTSSSKSGQARATLQNGKIPSIKPETSIKNAFNTKPDITKLVTELKRDEKKINGGKAVMNKKDSPSKKSLNFLFNKTKK